MKKIFSTPMQIIRHFFASLFGFAVMCSYTGSAFAAVDMCADVDMTIFKRVPQIESWYDLSQAVKCIAEDGLNGSESVMLLNTLDGILNSLDGKERGIYGSNMGGSAMEIARALKQYGDTSGFEHINNFFDSADWRNREVQGFFDAAAAHDFDNELKEVSLIALYRLPVTSGEVGRACQTFNLGMTMLPGHEVKLDDPRYLKGVLHALHRFRVVAESYEEWHLDRFGKAGETFPRHIWKESSQDYWDEPCREAFLTQILDKPMREAFEKEYLETLAPGERAIYEEYYERIKPEKNETDVINAMTSVILETDWGFPYEQWVSKNQSYECINYHGGSWVVDTGEQWCYLCENQVQGINVKAYFYLDDKLRECKLQGLRLNVEHAGEGLAKDLARLLERHIGIPAPPREVHRFGSGHWKQMTIWDWEDREVIVFKDESESQFGHGVPSVEILAEEYAVKRAIERYQLEEERIETVNGARNYDLFMQMLDESATHFPEIAKQIREVKNVESHYAVLKALLQKMRERDNDIFLLMLTEEYAERFFKNKLSYKHIDREPEKWEQRKQELEGMGLSVGYDREGELSYDNNILQNALALNATGYWAEVALLKGMRSSCWWNLDPEGHDTGIIKTIEKGERALNNGVDKRIMAQFIYSLAEIHETGWSLALASDDDEETNYESFRQYKEMHRKRAIELYRKFLDVCSECPEVEIVKWRLKRLIMDIDTSARHNFCFVC